jgi:hypothetical protein
MIDLSPNGSEGTSASAARNKKAPHKHAEVIKAWADGADIEFRYLGSATVGFHVWRSLSQVYGHAVVWAEGFEYRVKPERVVQDVCVTWLNSPNTHIHSVELGENYSSLRNVRFTFEDGKLIAAEVLRC